LDEYELSNNTTQLYTAVYIAGECTVTYDSNGGSGSAPSGSAAVEGSYITVASKGDLYREGYNFVGWNTAADGTGDTYQPGDLMPVESNVTLYAIWLSSEASENAAAVAAAKLTVESYDWTVTQETANTIESVKSWIETQLSAMELNGVNYIVNMTADSFVAAIEGTIIDLNGTNGSFGFAIKLTKGADDTLAEEEATGLAGVITATRYTEPGYLLGDVNRDGLVDAADIDALRAQIGAGFPGEIPAEQLLVSDLNRDGLIDTRDLLILRKFLGTL